MVVGRAIERPTDPQVRLDLGRNMEKLGDVTGAVREYQIAARGAPSKAVSNARAALEAIYGRLAWSKPPSGPIQ